MEGLIDQPPIPDVSSLSAHSHFANLSLRRTVADTQDEIPVLPPASSNSIAPIADAPPGPADKSKQQDGFKVGIVGAGVAGLFTGMIFDHLNQKFGLEVDYEILESRPQHVGGRLFTYHFVPSGEDPEVQPHEYYDVGAMRFPDIPIMAKTFQLFKLLGMEKRELSKAKEGDLIPYILTASNTPLKYNDIQVIPNVDSNASPQKPYDKNQVTKTKVTASAFAITGLPSEVMTQDATSMVDDEISVYTAAYSPQAPAQFWKLLMKLGDQYSVRQYLRQQDFKYNTIEFLETLNFGNRWYDQAFSEMVLETIDFDPTADWRCVLGGSGIIADKMYASLKKPKAVQQGQRVSEIKYLFDGNLPDKVEVTTDDGSPRTYDAVFNSAPLGAQQHMQLEGLKLSWGVKQAIRSLGYGASCKVGIRFRDLWWMTKYKIFGGVAKTDMPLRCCVYPSYNIENDPSKPGVLLVSYTWSQEAERIGSLITPNSPVGEEELKKVLLHDLARLHTKDDKDYEELLGILNESYITHYAYNWYADPHQVGAFAYFGPGQFSNMYPAVTASYGKYMIIGEAASAHHAWVVGALESAVRGVYQFLRLHRDRNKAAGDAYRAYNDDAIEGPFGPVPAEYSRTSDVHAPEVKPAPSQTLDPALKVDRISPAGELLRQGALFEKLRLLQGGDVLDAKKVDDLQSVKSILGALQAVQSQ